MVCITPALTGGVTSTCFLAGWKQRKSDDGKVYYVNMVEKTTTWDRPTAPAGKPSEGLMSGACLHTWSEVVFGS